MTVLDATRWVDDKLHNVYSLEDKLSWLAQVEKMTAQLHERCGLPFREQTLEPESTLSIPGPFDQLYLRWLEAQIHYAGQEYLKYNNAIALFTELWQEFANRLRRESAGVGRRKFF